MVYYKITHKNFPQALTEITKALLRKSLFRNRWPDNLQNKKHGFQSLTLGSADDEYVAPLRSKKAYLVEYTKKIISLGYECQTAANINLLKPSGYMMHQQV